jgi:hypothetical protein
MHVGCLPLVFLFRTQVCTSTPRTCGWSVRPRAAMPPLPRPGTAHPCLASAPSSTCAPTRQQRRQVQARGRARGRGRAQAREGSPCDECGLLIALITLRGARRGGATRTRAAAAAFGESACGSPHRVPAPRSWSRFRSTLAVIWVAGETFLLFSAAAGRRGATRLATLSRVRAAGARSPTVGTREPWRVHCLYIRNTRARSIIRSSLK